jgi:glutathione synthase/RimK-type ligase-like ATP-grasp enzyme
MIYKLMHPLFANDADGEALGLYTTLITESDIEARLESVRMAPCLFQEYIPKHYELRVNVIGNYVWAAGIFSQAAEQTQIDYRHDTVGCSHAPVLVPPMLERMCIRLARHLGLRMCNIDLILTPAGEYVFLEVNPNGQWAWVEDLVGFPLAAALVDELLGVDTLAEHPYLKQRSLRFTADTAIKQC